MNQGLKPRRKCGDATSGIDDGEVITSFVCIIVLVLYIVHDHLISDGAAGRGKESPAPEVFAPELLLEFGELLEYLPGRLAFEILGYFGDRDLWWHGDEEMDVIF